MNIKAKYFVSKTEKSDHKCLDCDQGDEGLKKILPIVYHPKYNITFGGLEKVHPFDSQKYGRVYKELINKLII